MKTDTFAGILFSYIRTHRKAIAIYCLFILVFILVFSLYSLPLDAVLYAGFLSACFAAVLAVYDSLKYYSKHKILSGLKKQKNLDLSKIPAAGNLIEADYQDLLDMLMDEKRGLSSQLDARQTEMVDYYTLWAHQIKTPISAMRLLLEDAEMLAELFKIEQYVEMVLGYLRIESASSDLVFQNYRLAAIIRQSVKNYASVFIRKKITLDFREMDCVVLTDEKWLVFVLDQLLSNALKYTRSGGRICISMPDTNAKILWIEDTGIGIAEEDLPRVFEKGFTGYNGRMDKKATGIGLYLSKKVLNKLSHKIEITSKVGIGTTVKIDLSGIETIKE